MKRLIIVLIFTTICGRYYVGDKHSESLSAALQAGRNRIETIVQSSNLEEELMSLPYLGFFTVRNWIIISRDSCYYHIRIGKFTNEEYSLKKIPISEDEGLSSLFELKEDLSNYTINDVYSPFYYYFVLFSNDHSSYVECNSMMNANKKSRNKKRGTLLPEEGMRVLWSLLINEYSEHLIACGTVSSMSTTSESNDYEVNDEVVYENVDVWPLYELLQPAQCRYWEDYAPCCQQRIIQSNKVAKIVHIYLEKKWTPTEDKRTFDLLEELTSLQADPEVKALYFSVFNSLLLLNNDGAIGEAISDYVHILFSQDPIFVINYIMNHQTYNSIYKQELALFCYFADKDVITLRQEIEGRLQSNNNYSGYLEAFFSDIEKLIANYQ